MGIHQKYPTGKRVNCIETAKGSFEEDCTHYLREHGVERVSKNAKNDIGFDRPAVKTDATLAGSDPYLSGCPPACGTGKSAGQTCEEEGSKAKSEVVVTHYM
ncbi:MAG: hypothetical protein JEY71_14350 [Sphaerochaeta sp.]|nr:hypothetical protein [Sphaerochaeta sp.]